MKCQLIKQQKKLQQSKRHKKVKLLSMKDIQKLYNYLKDNTCELSNDLLKSCNYSTWLELLKATLTSIQFYKRRRADEMEKVLIEDYKCYKCIGEHTDPEVYNSLSESGKEVISIF